MHITTTHSQKVQSKRGEYASIYEWTPHKCMGKSDQGSPIHLRIHSTRDSTYNALFFSIFSFVPFEPKIFCWCLEIFITLLFLFHSLLCVDHLCFGRFIRCFFLLQVFWARILENREYCVGVFYNLNLCADFAVYLRLRKECKEEVDEKKEEIRFNRRAGSCQWIYDTMNETKRLSSIVSPFNWYGEKNTHSIS